MKQLITLILLFTSFTAFSQTGSTKIKLKQSVVNQQQKTNCKITKNGKTCIDFDCNGTCDGATPQQGTNAEVRVGGVDSCICDDPDKAKNLKRVHPSTANKGKIATDKISLPASRVKRVGRVGRPR